MRMDKIARVSLKALPGKDLQEGLFSARITTIKINDLLKKSLYGPTDEPISEDKLDDLSFIAETTPTDLFKKPILVMIKQKRDDLLEAGTVVVVDGAHRLIALNRVSMRREQAFKDLTIDVISYAVPSFYFEEMVTLPRFLLDPHGSFQVPEIVSSWAYAISVHNCKFSAPEGANELAVVRKACEVACKWMLNMEPEAVVAHWPQQAIAHDLVALQLIRLVSTKFLGMYSFAPKQFMPILQEIHGKGKLPKTPMCDYLLRIMKHDTVGAAAVLKEINEQDLNDDYLYNKLRDLLPTKPNETPPAKRRRVRSNLTSAKYGGKKRSIELVNGVPPRMIEHGNSIHNKPGTSYECHGDSTHVKPMLNSAVEEEEEWKPLIMDELEDVKPDASVHINAAPVASVHIRAAPVIKDHQNLVHFASPTTSRSSITFTSRPNMPSTSRPNMPSVSRPNMPSVSRPITTMTPTLMYRPLNTSSTPAQRLPPPMPRLDAEMPHYSGLAAMIARTPQPVPPPVVNYIKPTNTKKKTKLAAEQTKDRWNYLLRGIPDYQKLQIIQEMEKMGVQFIPKTPYRNRYSLAWGTEMKGEMEAKWKAEGGPNPFQDDLGTPTVETKKPQRIPVAQRKIYVPRTMPIPQAKQIKVQPTPQIPVVSEINEPLFATVKEEEEANGVAINGNAAAPQNGTMYNGVLEADAIKEEATGTNQPMTM